MRPIPLILASASPRRRFLMDLTGLPYQVQPADMPEAVRQVESPKAYVSRLAQEKALHVSRHHNAEKLLILAADTTVVDCNAILGKPADADEARAMLLRLRGHEHHVMTAVAAVLPGGEIRLELCISTVPMRHYSNAEIDAYIQSGDPMDKAGAYAIQHGGFHPVAGFNGCYASVMGLPLCHLYRMLRHTLLAMPEDIAERCQSALGYTCSIHQSVLSGENVG